MIRSLTQRHLLPVVTPAAILTGVGRIHLHQLPTSFFRFVGQFAEEFRPRGICNTFGKAMVMGHALHVQVFNADYPETVDNTPGLLVSEIVAPKRDTLMHPRNDFAMFPPLRRTFGLLRVLALDFGQSLLFLAEKAGIGYFFTRAERGKGLESYVYSDLGRHCGQAFRFALARETHVPLAGRTASDGTGFHLALHRPVIDHLDTANLGKRHTVIMGEAKAALREGEAIVSILTLEPGKTRVLGVLSDSSEECLEGQVNAHRNVLQDLRMHSSEGRTFLLQNRKRVLLLKTGERNTVSFIGRLAHFQQVVIEPTTLFQGLVELVKLFLGEIDAIHTCFQHSIIVVQTEQECKRRTAPHLPSPNKERFSSPWLKPGPSSDLRGKHEKCGTA